MGFGENIPERGGRGQAGHVPVLLKEAIDFLAIQRGGTYLDATVGLGGHSIEIAKRLGAPGHLIGFDKDPAALERATAVLSSQFPVLSNDADEGLASEGRQSRLDWPTVSLIHASFAEMGSGWLLHPWTEF